MLIKLGCTLVAISILCYQTLASPLLPPRCPRYHCGNITIENACAVAEFSNGTFDYMLQPCKNQSNFCNISESFNEPSYCVPHPQMPTLLPGEYCKNNKECLSNVCKTLKRGEGTVCYGTEKNHACKADENCNPGLYCLSGSCQPLLGLGKRCDAKRKCVVTAVCDKEVCVNIGSKNLGDHAQIPSACSSFYVYEGKCAKGPFLIFESAVDELKCPKSGECIYYMPDLNVNKSEPCICGMSDNSEGYCMLGRGNMVMDDVCSFSDITNLSTSHT